MRKQQGRDSWRSENLQCRWWITLRGRLTIVDGCQPVESVYVNLRTAVLPSIRQEIVEVTQSEVDQLCGEDGRRQSIGSGGRPICIDHIRPAAARGQIFDFAVYLHLKFIQLRLFSLSFFHINRQLGQIVKKQESKVWNLINGQWRWGRMNPSLAAPIKILWFIGIFEIFMYRHYHIGIMHFRIS